MQNNYKKFDIVMVDFGTDVVGSEQGHIRPALIVQNDHGNIYSSCTIVIPFSTKIKKINQPTHSLIKKGEEKGLKEDSMLLGECIRQISEKRIIKKIGNLSSLEDIKEVKRIYEANFG